MLIFPDFATLETHAWQQGLQFSSREELVHLPEIQGRYAGIVSAQNEGLAQFEKLKKFCIVPDELSPGNGTLTASLKLRRRAIEERYRGQIEAMYEEAEVVR